MNVRGVLWAALLAIIAGAAHADPRGIVLACSQQAPQDDLALATLENDCPQLQQALTALGIRPLLSADTRATLSARQLPTLLGLTLMPAGDVRSAPDPHTVSAALQTFAPSLTTRFWDRVRAWMAQQLQTPADSSTAVPTWLRWLARLMGIHLTILTVLTLLLLCVAVVVAIAVIWRELRDAGVLGRQRADAGAAGASLDSGALLPITLAEVESAPLSQRPALWFRLLARTLADVGRLPDDRSLTHRELARRARLDSPSQRAAWQHVSAAAERQLFAPQLTQRDDITAAAADAAMLYASVLAPGA